MLTRIPSDERNLAVRSFKAYFAEMGLRPPDVEVTCLSRIPVARGLGSSAAAIVAGITAAEAMAGQGVDVQRKLNVAARIEGHPDNTSACILGGVTVSSMVSSTVLWAKVPLALQLDAVVAVPDFTLSTAVARNVLPGSVLHSDAVFNVGRAARRGAAGVGRPANCAVIPRTPASAAGPGLGWGLRCAWPSRPVPWVA